MRRRHKIAWILVAAALAFALLGCGGATPETLPPQTAAKPKPKPKPKNAAKLARAMVQGRIGVLVYVDRVRSHPISDDLAALRQQDDFLKGSGLDPLEDADRAYLAATGTTTDDQSVAVVQHKLSEKEAKEAVDKLIEKSEPPGKWLDGYGAPAARLTVRGHTRIVVLIKPNFAVIAPESIAKRARALVGTGGFVEPTGPEAIIATALSPSETLRGGHMPRIPPTIQSATATVVLEEDGGAKVALDAVSTNEAQAQQDAEELTRTIDKATSVKVSVVKVRFFKRVKFRAEGSHVKADIELTKEELARLMSFARLAAAQRR